MEMTLTLMCFLNVRLMDAKDKTVFYILKMFNKNI